MTLTRRGVPRYRPRHPNDVKVHLLSYDIDDNEIESEVTVVVGDWEDFSIDSVWLAGWDIEPLLTDDQRNQIEQHLIDHIAVLADQAEAAEEDYGDYLMELRRDG